MGWYGMAGSHGYVGRGLYAAQLEILYSVFPPSQVVRVVLSSSFVLLYAFYWVLASGCFLAADSLALDVRVLRSSS